MSKTHHERTDGRVRRQAPAPGRRGTPGPQQNRGGVGLWACRNGASRSRWIVNAVRVHGAKVVPRGCGRGKVLPEHLHPALRGRPRSRHRRPSPPRAGTGRAPTPLPLATPSTGRGFQLPWCVASTMACPTIRRATFNGARSRGAPPRMVKPTTGLQEPQADGAPCAHCVFCLGSCSGPHRWLGQRRSGCHLCGQHQPSLHALRGDDHRRR